MVQAGRVSVGRRNDKRRVSKWTLRNVKVGDGERMHGERVDYE